MHEVQLDSPTHMKGEPVSNKNVPVKLLGSPNEIYPEYTVLMDVRGLNYSCLTSWRVKFIMI